jgi:hypothetical protein
MTLCRPSIILAQTESRSGLSECPQNSIVLTWHPFQCIGRVPDVTAPSARYPYEVTLHQGEIENLFLDSMRKEGLEVDRPVVPISLRLSEDQEELANPCAYPVKVRSFPELFPEEELIFRLTYRSC